ncbi:hypothetical protein ACHHYP_05408 [Achlya hypogyna]|uniref:Uncharacterized protein n=1 Tax=Achlya hypogyna TaxID=1202772 RepID=A0A1V9ZNT3_ACHHY|nr:hypothetical protein ACHHYP_05408 [Achlya hypogyna]
MYVNTNAAKPTTILAILTGILMHAVVMRFVVCDGAPDVTGVHGIVQSEQLLAAFNTTNFLYEFLAAQRSLFFVEVTCAKLQSSRMSSNEQFLVYRGFQPPPRYPAEMQRNPDPISLFACGDLSSYDKQD